MSSMISICVPVYNVAPYIERCVRSLMEQSYPNIEYIFVDDCSTDESMAILERVVSVYPDRKENIHIVHNDRNRGLAYTRRVSIDQAQGEYIVCVDSDDWIEPEMVQYMVDKAQETGANIVAGGYIHEHDKRQEIEMPISCKQDEDYIYIALADRMPHLCNKLILRSLFTGKRNCYAPEGLNYLEDRMTLFYLFTKVQRVATIDRPLYHYVHHEGSVSQGKNEYHFQCLIRYWEEVDKELRSLGLTDTYSEIVGQQKIADKAFMLMHCDNRTRKMFVNLYAEEEQQYTPSLSRGIALMYRLSKHHLWILTYCFDCYNHWLYRHKKVHSFR